jgi:threonine/homoserine/homoserine lactone efflux protein
MVEDIQAAIPLGFFLAFMIGPVFFVLLETSATKGFRAAVAFDLGVIIITGPSLENDINRFLVFFGTMILAYFITDLFKILLAKQLKSKLTPKRILKVKKLLGLILIVCGLVLIVKGFLPKDQLNPQNLIEDIGQ